jgi:deoxycytidine triphosphate deaminase
MKWGHLFWQRKSEILSLQNQTEQILKFYFPDLKFYLGEVTEQFKLGNAVMPRTKCINSFAGYFVFKSPHIKFYFPDDSNAEI